MTNRSLLPQTTLSYDLDPQPRLFPSLKWGLVSVSHREGLTHPATAEDSEDLDRETVIDLLTRLGHALGLQILKSGPSEHETPGFETDETASRRPQPEENNGAHGDEAFAKTLESLDLVWTSGEETVAAFILQPTFGAWEGIRQLGDLLTLQPKTKAALYAVTTHRWKPGLIQEIHRPIYRHLKKPLTQALRILDWPKLREEVDSLGDRARYLKPEFLQGISQTIPSTSI